MSKISDDRLTFLMVVIVRLIIRERQYQLLTVEEVVVRLKSVLISEVHVFSCVFGSSILIWRTYDVSSNLTTDSNFQRMKPKTQTFAILYKERKLIKGTWVILSVLHNVVVGVSIISCLFVGHSGLFPPVKKQDLLPCSIRKTNCLDGEKKEKQGLLV